jgi:hypothetical protein
MMMRTTWILVLAIGLLALRPVAADEGAQPSSSTGDDSEQTGQEAPNSEDPDAEQSEGDGAPICIGQLICLDVLCYSSGDDDPDDRPVHFYSRGYGVLIATSYSVENNQWNDFVGGGVLC